MKDTDIGKKTWTFFHLLHELNVTLAYQGFFDQETVKSFLKMTENKLHEENLEETVRKKLFLVLVESLQNICKHQKFHPEKESTAIFLLGRNAESYFVFTGNQIMNDKIEALKNKIDTVNGLDKEGLKEFYKSTRLAAEISSAGGAGLGFIDIARKSGNKLVYHFEPVQSDTSFFTLLSTITIN